tara:strand:+ start:472 stop:2736 length:2265 start_codon:yes stop_codon:yes gene_type:complete
MSEAFVEEKEINFNKLFKAILRRKRILIFSASLFLSSSLLYSAIKRIISPTYSGSFVFLINDPLESSSSNQNLQIGEAFQAAGYFDSFLDNNTQQDIPTLIELLKSTAFLKPFAEENDLDTLKLTKNLTLKKRYDGFSQSSKGSIKVKYNSRSPIKVLETLENLKEYYLGIALKERNKKLTEGVDFLEKQEPLLEKKAINLQNELANFRVKNNLVDPIAESQELTKRLTKKEMEIAKLNTEALQYLEIKKKIKRGDLSVGGFKGIIPTSINKSSGGVGVTKSDAGFLEKSLELENELAEARLSFLPNSKRVLNLENRLKLLKPEIQKKQLETVNVSISLNNSKLSVVKEQKEILEKKFLKLSNLIEPFTFIIQNLETVRFAQLDLKTTKEKYLLELAQKGNNWRILQNPKVKKYPTEPSFLKNILIALIAGVSIGAILALIRDNMDNVFHSSDELKDSDLTILGEIPFVNIFENFKTLKDIRNWYLANNAVSVESADNNQSYYLDAFRNLFTSIKFFGSENPLRVISLTSTQPLEGKSSISLMLSKTLSEVGQNILLIDCDMRQPHLHEKLNLNNIKGLTNILTEKDGLKDWQKYIQEISNHGSWKLISSGTIPPDPTRILSSSKMHEFVNILREDDTFDLIIFDTPPVERFADASLLGSITDGLIFVVSLEKVDKNMFYQSINRLTNLGNKVLGLVINEIKKPTNQKSKKMINYKEVYGEITRDIKESNKKNLNENFLILKKYWKYFCKWIDE